MPWVVGLARDWDYLHGSDFGGAVPRFAILRRTVELDEFRKTSDSVRTPLAATEYASTAGERGLEVIIAGAGGAAHLAGVLAAHTVLPLLGVPMESAALKGMDSLLSTVQMPAGIPVGTLAIGKPGAVNAALLAIAILATHRPDLREKLESFRAAQAERILSETL